MRKLVIAAAALVLLLMGGFVGYDQWAKAQAIASIRPHVKLASLQATAVLEFEAGKGSPSYIEYLRRASEVVGELDKALLAVRAADASRAQASQAVAVDYIRTLQEVIREMARARQTMLSAQVAQKAAISAAQEAEASGQYGREQAVERAKTLLSKARSGWDEVDQAMKKADEKLTELERQSASVSNTFGAEAALSVDLLGAVKAQRKK
jgi:hypothetical protein